ncbi:MAG TPA: TonB family protein [Chryseosolibacter sp.]
MFSIKEKQRPESYNERFRKRKTNPAVTPARGQTQMGAGAKEKRTGEEVIAAGEAEGQSWDEMVFERRNREYGAYLLRKGYNHNVAVGLIVTVLVVTLILLSPYLAKWLRGSDGAVNTPPRKLVYTELSAPPPIDKPKPLPPAVQLPRLKKVIKFVPPRVVKEDVVQSAPVIEDIRVNDTDATEVNEPAAVVFDEPVEEVVSDDNELFTVVDQQPEFEGGYDALMAFIKQNMQYPNNARRMRIEGTVHVGFIVSKTGEISDVTVLRGFMAECDREAVRVVKLMPRWKPGKQNGRNVNVRCILPLKFRLN